MAPKKDLPTEPSKARFAQKQAPQPAAGELPPPTEDQCPACNAAGVLRRAAGTTIVGLDGRLLVRRCRVGHEWSPERYGGDKALEAMEAARVKRRAARAVSAARVGAGGMAVKSASAKLTSTQEG